jgi:threonine synthase
VDGDFDAAMDLVRQAAPDLCLYLLNSVNPWRIEGQKTVVIELLHQLAWNPPDWLVLPGGNLGHAAACGKALAEMAALGLIRRMPRLAVIQASGANPFYRAYRTGFRTYEPGPAETIATAIRIGRPVSYQRARRAIEGTDGVVEQVTDDEILAAKALVDRVGIGCEPASAASVAGVLRLVQTKVIQPGQQVVAILTGHLLKDPEAVLRTVAAELPPSIPPDRQAVRAAVERLLC